MKKLMGFLFACLYFFSAAGAEAVDAAPGISARAMILIHPDSGTVLAEKNADEPHLIASTTKLMTALVAAESGDLSRVVEIPQDWEGVEGSSMYLRPGETYTFRELLQGLLLVSGNDAALALALAVSDGEDAFSDAMNARAEALGCENTRFSNPHGLDAPDHRSTARDLARIMTAVMENDELRDILGEKSCVIHNVSYFNHNKLLWNCPGVDAGKTGYTMAAGRCLVSHCRRNGLDLICVTLSDPDDWKDHAALYDWAFGQYQCVSVPAGKKVALVPVISGAVTQAAVSVPEGRTLCLPKDVEITVSCTLPPFAFAPLYSGTAAGELTIRANGATVCSQPLVWAEDTPAADVSGHGEVFGFNRFIGAYAV